MKTWLHAVLVNPPAVLLMLAILCITYLTIEGHEVPDALVAIAGLLVGMLAFHRHRQP